MNITQQQNSRFADEIVKDLMSKIRDEIIEQAEAKDMQEGKLWDLVGPRLAKQIFRYISG